MQLKSYKAKQFEKKIETEFCRNRDIVIINVDLFNIKFTFS